MVPGCSIWNLDHTYPFVLFIQDSELFLLPNFHRYHPGFITSHNLAEALCGFVAKLERNNSKTEEKTKESKRLTPLISRVVVFCERYDERRLRNDTDSKERSERDKRRRKARPTSSGT
jgi:hypothetical protein